MTNHIIDSLVEAGRWAASADNMQPWRFDRDGLTLRLFFVGRGDPAVSFGIDSPASLLALGGVIENMTQMAQALGCPLDEAAIFPDDEPDCVFRCRPDIAAAALSTAPAARNHRLFLRHTNRLPYASTAVPEAVAAQMAALTQGDARCLLTGDKAALGRWAALVRRASELRFQNGLAHTALDASLRMSEAEAARGDGLDVATFYLPPGGKTLLSYTRTWARMAVLNRFGLYKMFAAIEADLFRKGPAMLMVTGAPGRQGALDAGRLLHRAWSQLNDCGLAAQPFYVVADQIFRLDDGTVPEPLRPAARALGQAAGAGLAAAFASAPAAAATGTKTLYMLLRIGYPDKPAVKSRRLPTAQLFSPTSPGDKNAF